ncbi:MAG: hypothetical protein ACNI28_09210 [Arcobacter sp.]|uniref:hypothetical protein n=1 Tax=Arcobacter sp. TaxID=1872629 RepID=UPI003B008B62
MREEKIELADKNKVQKYIGFVREYFSLIIISLLAILLMFDYFIFTDVLHLNQAYFFNNLLSIIAQEQPILLIFVILPILFIVLIFGLLYKIQFDFLNHFFEDSYPIAYKIFNSKNIIYKIFIVIFSIIFIIYGDILVFFTIEFLHSLLEDTDFKMTTLAFLFTLYLLYVIYNVLVLFLISLISSRLIIKFKTHNVISFFLGFLVGLKLVAYPLLQFVPYLKDLELKSFLIFILLNFAFFLPTAIIVIAKKFNKNFNSSKKESNLNNYIGKFIFLIILLIGINIFFFNLNKLHEEPYTKKEFWKKIPINSLSQGNFSLLLSPLKIVSDNEMIIDLNKIKEDIIKKFALKEKAFENIFVKDIKYFYIPYQNYRIIFIQDKNDTTTILTAYAFFEKDTLVKILDVGFIKLK